MESQYPRFDYVSFRFDGTWRHASEEAQYVKDLYAQVRPKDEVGKQSGIKEWYHADKTSDGYVFWVEIWGPICERIVETMPQRFFRKLTRLDYRWTVHNENYTVDDIFECARATSGVAQTISRLQNRPRTKRGNRDAGGNFVGIGSAGSDRRITYYQRGKEHAAFELQLRGLGIKRVIDSAWHRWENVQNTSFVDNLTAELERTATDVLKDRTSLELDVVVGRVQRASQETAFVRQENLLDAMEDIWAKLDKQAQESFLETRMK